MLLYINTTQNLNLKKINKEKKITCRVGKLTTAKLIVEEQTMMNQMTM